MDGCVAFLVSLAVLVSQSASLWEANASFSPNDVHRQVL